ncbi:carbonic anhydrase 2-like isoform X2 [Phalaenopsis equestris]|uniref:carbonic anhydrase 2-like isoform X2 n=1 Tax=Phalaenopsis equestris TaxID=78828 RepID=UPI0009E61A10|nr:carbonic anhydrase 2-like isoform X2 [Phalaenopsis equestris]
MASLLRSHFFQPPTTNLSTDANFMEFPGKPMESLKMNFSPLLLVKQKDTYWRRTYSVVMATKDPCGLGKELKEIERHGQDLKDNDSDPLKELEARFLKFKKQNYLENLDHYQNLAQGQSPKFMVIACADSRVCPSKILGFQPGEAFTVRNVANLVPPYQHGASETSAALEFAVTSLEVSNILVVGHSCCGGIRALMSMKRKSNSKSFIRDWVSLAKSARLSTEAAVGNRSFEEQCAHCEKESINGSLLNLLTYPWIDERVTKGALSLHGGYYDFTNCSFEKWTLVYRKSLEGGSKFAIRGCSTWS